MLDFFIEYMNYEMLGRIDNAHLALADQSEELANNPACLKLSELHSHAVDFAKTGYKISVESKLMPKEFPDFMEKKEKESTYESKTVLGRLYRQVS